MAKVIQSERLASYSEEVSESRKPEFPVHPIILNRWSPRSYLSHVVSDQVLYTVLEAAKWAPSGGNIQPWRFYVAKTKEQLELFQTFIRPRNRLWTSKAPVLLLIASVVNRDNGDHNPSHSFDAGAAWATLSLQAGLLGLSTRAVGGFDQELARQTLQTPADIELHAVIALGYRGQPESLDASFQEQEQPSHRRPIEESILRVPSALTDLSNHEEG